MDVNIPPSNRGLNSMILPIGFLVPPANVSFLNCHRHGPPTEFAVMSVDLYELFSDGGFVDSARVFCQPMFSLFQGTSSGG